MTTEARLFHSSNHHKWRPYQTLGGKTVRNIHIDSQTTEMWPTELKVPLSVNPS